MSRKKTRFRKRKKPIVKPKRKWPKYVVLVSLGILGAIGIINKSEEKIQGKQESVKSIPTITIPPASIRIEEKKLGQRDKNFQEINLIVESFLEKDQDFPDTAYPIDKQVKIPFLLGSIKEKLESSGFKITLNAKTPEEIFDALFRYYEKNNTYIMIRTSKSGLKSFWKFPIKEKARHSFSGFGGKISWNQIPVYYIDKNAPDYKIPEGFPTKHGLIVFVGFPKGQKFRPGVDLKKGINDLVMHEGVHYSTIKRMLNEASDEFDFDKIKSTKSSEKDELKAYLMQMMYGAYPRVALDSLMLTNVESYNYAKRSILTSFKKILRNNPERKLRYEKGESLDDQEIRKFAYLTFIKYFNLR